MATASAAEQFSILAEGERFPALEVVLHQQTYILPWSQFLYAQGADDQLRAVFTTHDVLVAGSGLSALLYALATQQLAWLREPARTDRFGTSDGPRLTALSVKAVDPAATR